MSFSEKTVECRRIYEKFFNPTNFLQYYTDTVNKPAEKSERFFNGKTIEAFSSGKVKGARCVDVGGGPTIHRLAIASRCCDVLYSSDFLKVNRDAVNSYLSSSKIDPLYEELLGQIAVLEGYENIDSGVQAISHRLKSKLRGSVPCDVLLNHPLGELDLLGGPFDVAITNGCLETACTSLVEFKQAIKNLSNLLRPGGKLLLMTYLGEDFYKISDTSYPVIVLHESEVEEALKEAGFSIDSLDISSDVDSAILKHCNTTSFLFAVAVKPF